MGFMMFWVQGRGFRVSRSGWGVMVWGFDRKNLKPYAPEAFFMLR